MRCPTCGQTLRTSRERDDVRQKLLPKGPTPGQQAFWLAVTVLALTALSLGVTLSDTFCASP